MNGRWEARIAIGAEPEPLPKVHPAKVAAGIGVTLLLFVGIWRIGNPPERKRTLGDLEERYLARGIDPSKVF
jgi:hypothetical protein